MCDTAIYDRHVFTRVMACVFVVCVLAPLIAWTQCATVIVYNNLTKTISGENVTSIKDARDSMIRGRMTCQHVNLSNNLIREIHKTDLQGLINIKTLDLSYNTIYSVDKNVFTYTIQLINLSLTGNSELELPANGPFIISNSLKMLNLDYCNLSMIPEMSFSKLPSLEVLNISNNGITNVYRDTFKILMKSLSDLVASGNMCECALLKPAKGHEVRCVIVNKNSSCFKKAKIRYLAKIQDISTGHNTTTSSTTEDATTVGSHPVAEFDRLVAEPDAPPVISAPSEVNSTVSIGIVITVFFLACLLAISVIVTITRLMDKPRQDLWWQDKLTRINRHMPLPQHEM